MGLKKGTSYEKTGVVSVRKVDTKMVVTRSQNMLIQGSCEENVTPVKVVMRIEVQTPPDEVMILSTCRVVPKDRPKRCLSYD